MASDDDLFADSDSDDTADLIATTKAATASSSSTKLKKVPAKKKAPAKKKKNDSDDDKDLFDSDSDDDDDDDKKPAALSKREKLAALALKKASVNEPKKSSRSNNRKSSSGGDGNKEKNSGYDSDNSYDSAEFQRTQADDDFLDTTGEDAEAVQELYATQHFDDEDRPMGGKDKKKRKYRSDEAIEDNGELDNPVMAAVHRMKKKKRDKKTFTDMEDEAKLFLDKMETAAEQDEVAVQERKLATKKLSLLSTVVDMLTRKDMQRMLLDLDLLSVCKRWVQPLPDGQLGNVTIRQRLLTTIGGMTGETGISATDLKRSEFGKIVMVLFKHPQETPAVKRLLKNLIEQWSRPIFQKSGNMRDLERVHAVRGEGGLAAISRQNAVVSRGLLPKSGNVAAARVTNPNDLQSMIATGKKAGAEASAGVKRVSVPFSKGFDYTVRPMAKANGPIDKRMARTAPSTDTRGKLSKRMVEKGRSVSKNQRSANISIEGRRTKG